MNKQHTLGFILRGAIGSLFVVAPALAVHKDGGLPIYPNATPVGLSYSDPHAEEALKMGFAMFADTTDSTHTVDQWYQSNLPKSCSRHIESAGTQYKCPAGVVNIVVYKGKTRIAIIPNR